VPEAPATAVRIRLDLRGQVQGVGFRPCVYRLAHEFLLAGHVANSSNGAVIEVEGPPEQIAAFERALSERLPPLARITALRRQPLEPSGQAGFHIRHSETAASRRPEVAPDAATCDDCRRELFDPSDRRHLYPFINCTNCGPRYSIIRTVPYDRPATTMSVFAMCPPCAHEYADPADRRFHAQPTACAACGPRLRLCQVTPASAESPGHSAAAATPVDGDPIRTAAQWLAEGRILAVKGIGGYHLACRADRADVVERLRQRKLRNGKPLAVMVPSEQVARRVCRLSAADWAALTSPAAPIVLAPKGEEHGLAAGVAPGTDTFGIMLPSRKGSVRW
jgi:hydrogenase maturation protein HypF